MKINLNLETKMQRDRESGQDIDEDFYNDSGFNRLCSNYTKVIRSSSAIWKSPMPDKKRKLNFNFKKRVN